ncbi:UNVERIFIED_CONTAM: hypothetical protein Sangu_0374800 [Sesamum angustifolium]|uniref:Uncharacterized protein n=1 Tax=Sesamum angustifolium TaxID=2727405 RepID=A0AAW2QS83_9LAMI
MANSDNGGNNRSYEGNSSLLTAAGLAAPPTNPTWGAPDVPVLDPALGANSPAPAPTRPNSQICCYEPALL